MGEGTELSNSSRRLSTLGRTSSIPLVATLRFGFSITGGPALPETPFSWIWCIILLAGRGGAASSVSGKKKLNFPQPKKCSIKWSIYRTENIYSMHCRTVGIPSVGKAGVLCWTALSSRRRRSSSDRLLPRAEFMLESLLFGLIGKLYKPTRTTATYFYCDWQYFETGSIFTRAQSQSESDIYS